MDGLGFVSSRTSRVSKFPSTRAPISQQGQYPAWMESIGTLGGGMVEGMLYAQQRKLQIEEQRKEREYDLQQRMYERTYERQLDYLDRQAQRTERLEDVDLAFQASIRLKKQAQDDDYERGVKDINSDPEKNEEEKKVYRDQWYERVYGRKPPGVLEVGPGPDRAGQPRYLERGLYWDPETRTVKTAEGYEAPPEAKTQPPSVRYEIVKDGAGNLWSHDVFTDEWKPAPKGIGGGMAVPGEGPVVIPSGGVPTPSGAATQKLSLPTATQQAAAIQVEADAIKEQNPKLPKYVAMQMARKRYQHQLAEMQMIRQGVEAELAGLAEPLPMTERMWEVELHSHLVEIDPIVGHSLGGPFSLSGFLAQAAWVPFMPSPKAKPVHFSDVSEERQKEIVGRELPRWKEIRRAQQTGQVRTQAAPATGGPGAATPAGGSAAQVTPVSSSAGLAAATDDDVREAFSALGVDAKPGELEMWLRTNRKKTSGIAVP